ncbi:DUF885 family protein [Sediminibacterium soli]|uniref:DUF885 family protein n=1 Tax=Sediminibacterium soli TaxID=2698829 RepID=UPI00137A2162|nr:DUF885 family protein [Sediminibacterium soli]NCI45588.1 DUF885 domain-containing protein [Sediminibacterium soli]
MRKYILVLLAFAALSAAAQKTESSLYDQTSEVNNLMVHYNADNTSITRFYLIGQSPERRMKLKKMHEDYLSQLAKMDYDKLPVGSRVDYILFKRNLTNELRLLDLEENEYSQISKWIPFADSLYAVEKLRRRGAAMNAPLLAEQFNSIQRQVNMLTPRIKQETLTPALGERAYNAIKGLQTALKSVYDFYNGYDPLFTWWMATPYRSADSSLNLYANALRAKGKSPGTQKDDGSGIIGNPIGREELIQQLRFEMIPYTPEELIEIANKEFAWCDQELLKASREMGFGDNWKAAQEKVKNTFVPAGRQPQMIIELYNQSVDFIRKKDLVTLPSLADEDWTMNMMTPERQLFAPFFLGGSGLLIAYPTNTMKEDEKLMSMRGNNPHFSRAVVHHELLAGHHLQWYMNNRNKTYRNFPTPFWTEGNACYWEFVLWDQQFPRGPEDRIGMLFWRMHRCARIIFSLKYHLGEWTPQQCIDFLVDRVGHERSTAEGEVRRSFTGQYPPLYQIGYMIGAFQFWALKKELVDSGKMSYRQYHDAILRENAMPVEMLRAILTNQKLPKDFESSWRFYK